MVSENVIFRGGRDGTPNFSKFFTSRTGIARNDEPIDILITNEYGDKRDLAVVGDNDAVLIFPSIQNSIVEYNLDDVLILNDNLWSFKISYPQMISVLIPEGIDRVFVNDLPIQLGDKKGINCHGCSMNLQYYFTIPKIIQPSVPLKVTKVKGV